MKTVLNILAGICTALVLVLVISVVAHQSVNEVSLGSVQQGSEYHSTSTVAATAAGIYYVSGTSTALGGVLGSVTITSSSASQFTIEDANGTNTNTIAVFHESAAAGTYVFDRSMRYGIAITVPAGFNGQFVTTYR